MGKVPDSYYEFVMHYAPYCYVVPTVLTVDAAAGQKNVTVADGSKFQTGFPVQLKNSAQSEWNEIQSVLGNVLTMKNNIAYTYRVSESSVVEGPDPSFGQETLSAAFAIEFLIEAFSADQFSSQQMDEIQTKVVELADWLLTQQCLDSAKAAYGGFKSSEFGTDFWSIDAGRAIPALLKAYTLIHNVEYLNAARIAGYIFLYNMQQKPALLGIHDRYYGGFAQSVTLSEDWNQTMPVEDLYCMIGLKMLAQTYDSINAVRYNMMMNDVVAFLRIGLDKGLWLSYDPLPLGNGNWHRVNLAGLEVYDDSISFALLGLYYCEGWSLTCQHTYAFMQNIKPRGQYPGYNPEVCWAGYINVALGFPSCSYYDGVTIGILSKIRKEHDLPSFKLAHDVAEKYADKFLDWGPVFTDYSPITPAKAMANVAWIGRMFLDYEEPVTQFTRILKGKGESVLLFPVQQMVDAVQYGEPMDLLAVVSPLKAEQVLIEPGYYLNDYLALYTFIPLRNGDKIRRQGEDYEVQTVMPFIYANHRFCIKSTVRRLIA